MRRGDPPGDGEHPPCKPPRASASPRGCRGVTGAPALPHVGSGLDFVVQVRHFGAFPGRQGQRGPVPPPGMSRARPFPGRTPRFLGDPSPKPARLPGPLFLPKSLCRRPRAPAAVVVLRPQAPRFTLVSRHFPSRSRKVPPCPQSVSVCPRTSPSALLRAGWVTLCVVNIVTPSLGRYTGSSLN